MEQRKPNKLKEVMMLGDGLGYSDRKYWENLIHNELMQWFHRSDGNKHKFILDFLNLTEDDIKKEQ